jgi:hypothetical protein
MDSESIVEKVSPSTNGQPEPPAAAPDPFDVNRLRLSQDFAAVCGVKKHRLTIKVAKPSKEWFVRTHPDPAYRVQTAVLELKDDKDRPIYWVDPSIWPHLVDEPTFGPRVLYTAINRQRDLFFWPVRLPGIDGKLDDWSESAIKAAEMAKTSWVRVVAKMSLGAYEVFEATATVPEPEWPTEPVADLLRVAFKSKLIDSLDHPVLQQLRGDA